MNDDDVIASLIVLFFKSIIYVLAVWALLKYVGCVS